MRALLQGGLLAVAVLLLGACTGSPGPDEDAPPATPTPTPTPVAEPFALVIDHIEIVPMGNSEITTGRGPDVDPAVAEAATEAARNVLESFLNRQFVEAATRFSDSAFHDLLAPEAAALLSADARRALGALELPVDYTVTGPSRARADVAFNGSEAYFVTLDFDARLHVALADGRSEPVRQHGTITFVPTDDGWRAQGIDVRLEGPTPPTPSPAPTSESVEEET